MRGGEAAGKPEGGEGEEAVEGGREGEAAGARGDRGGGERGGSERGGGERGGGERGGGREHCIHFVPGKRVEGVARGDVESQSYGWST